MALDLAAPTEAKKEPISVGKIFLIAFAVGIAALSGLLYMYRQEITDSVADLRRDHLATLSSTSAPTDELAPIAPEHQMMVAQPTDAAETWVRPASAEEQVPSRLNRHIAIKTEARRKRRH